MNIRNHKYKFLALVLAASTLASAAIFDYANQSQTSTPTAAALANNKSVSGPALMNKSPGIVLASLHTHTTPKAPSNLVIVNDPSPSDDIVVHTSEEMAANVGVDEPEYLAYQSSSDSSASARSAVHDQEMYGSINFASNPFSELAGRNNSKSDKNGNKDHQHESPPNNNNSGNIHDHDSDHNNDHEHNSNDGPRDNDPPSNNPPTDLPPVNVPEPGTLALLALGLVGIMASTRRKSA